MTETHNLKLVLGVKDDGNSLSPTSHFHFLGISKLALESKK